MEGMVMAGAPVLLQSIMNSELAEWDTLAFLRKVTDVVPNVIYIFNQQTQSNEYTNRSLGEALGYNSEEVKHMGADMMPLLCHPTDLPSVGAHFGRIQQLEDGEVAQVEYRMKSKSGEWVWLLSHDTVFDRDADGNVLRHIGVAANITAQKHAEDAARTEHLKAAATNDELRAFSYSVSHDLKSPSNTLCLILNELIACHGDGFDDDARELVDMALSTTSRMGTMVDDVLNYTRVINQDTVIEPVDLEAVTADTIVNLSALVHTHDAEVTVDPLPDVMTDEMQLRILMQNLIENAIKFRQPGVPPHIEISAERVPHQKRAVIQVKDNGIGIHPDKHEQIFQIFKRLNNTVEFNGAGLGLAICRRIAANHGSTITLMSTPGNGATFSIELATS